MGSTEPEGASAPEPPRSPRFSLGKLYAVIGFAAALAGIVTAVPVVQGWVSGDEESCAREGATLANITVEERVPFREYLERTNASTEGYSAEQLDLRVNLVSYDLHVDGFKNKHLTSRWSVYDASTNTPVSDDQLTNRVALDVEPTACTTSLHPAIWTPAVTRRGRSYYTLFVYDDQGNLLAERRSNPLAPRA